MQEAWSCLQQSLSLALSLYLHLHTLSVSIKSSITPMACIQSKAGKLIDIIPEFTHRSFLEMTVTPLWLSLLHPIPITPPFLETSGPTSLPRSVIGSTISKSVMPDGHI
jgi:hypothetical protein